MDLEAEIRRQTELYFLREQLKTTKQALRELLEEVDALEGYELSRSYERPDQAETVWNDTINRARRACRE